MPSCPHCVHNWLFMNYLYSDGKNCNSHLCSHALTVFENRISHNYGGKNEACQYVVGLKMGDCFGFQSVMVE